MTDKLPELSRSLNRPQGEATINVATIAYYYPGFVKVYGPKKPIKATLPDWEVQKKNSHVVTLLEKKTSNETPQERSTRRTQKSVTDLLLCNRFEYFLTITFDPKKVERTDVEAVKKLFATFLKNQRDRNGKFKYVFVPEYHKDGAIHFHGVMSGYEGKLRHSRNKETGEFLFGKQGRPRYDLEEYKSGHTRVEPIGDTVTDQMRVSHYIRKYITKDMIDIFNKKRFWASQKLIKPVKEYNPEWPLENIPDDIYENEYGRIATYLILENKILPEYVRRLTSRDGNK